jgi:hypothetical protein
MIGVFRSTMRQNALNHTPPHPGGLRAANEFPLAASQNRRSSGISGSDHCSEELPMTVSDSDGGWNSFADTLAELLASTDLHARVDWRADPQALDGELAACAPEPLARLRSDPLVRRTHQRPSSYGRRPILVLPAVNDEASGPRLRAPP